MQPARQPQLLEVPLQEAPLQGSPLSASQRGHCRLRSLVSGSLLLLVGWLPIGMTAGGCGAEESAGVAPQAVDSGDASAPSQDAATRPPATGNPEAKPPGDADVSVTLASWAEILKAAKTEGRPAVLDVWSLGCEPCLKEFPGLVRLHRQWGEKLHCVSANIDFDGRKTRPPESYKSKVMDFLRLKEASLDNYLCTTPSDEIYTDLKIDSIPAVLVFDAQGKEVARFVDAGETLGFTYEKDIIPFVEKLLADDAAPPSSAAPASDK